MALYNLVPVPDNRVKVISAYNMSDIPWPPDRLLKTRRLSRRGPTMISNMDWKYDYTTGNRMTVNSMPGPRRFDEPKVLVRIKAKFANDNEGVA